MPIILYYKKHPLLADGAMLMENTEYVSTRSNARSKLLLKDYVQVTEEQFVNELTGQMAYIATMQEEGETNE